MSSPSLHAPPHAARDLVPFIAVAFALTSACADDTGTFGSGGGGRGGGASGPASGGSSPGSTGAGDVGGGTAASGSGGGSGGGASASCDDVTCPDGRVCVEDGACIVDLDPGDPVGAAVDDFDAIWRFFDERYGAFPAKDVDWDVVRDTYRPLVEAATTQFAAAWVTSRAVAELDDGHTAAYAAAICDVDPGFSLAVATVGACVTEIGDDVVVYDVTAESDFALGDRLVSIDGRTVEEALHDRARQPRCALSASTPAQDRANRVAGLLFEPSGAGRYVVERDGETVTLDVTPGAPRLDCDGRVGLDGEVERGAEIATAVTDDDVLVVRLARFGTFEDGELVDEPVIDALRDAFEEAGDHAGVVLDLRGNSGGYVSIYMALAGWLFDEPTVLFRCRNHTGPGHDDHAPPFSQTSTPDPSLHYDGPLAVAVDARSFSAADFTPMWIQATGRGVTVGAPTGGGFGNGNVGENVALDYFIGVNDILCEDLDGNLLEGHPPAVDVPVQLTREDVARGVDTVLEAAVAAVLTG